MPRNAVISLADDVQNKGVPQFWPCEACGVRVDIPYGLTADEIVAITRQHKVECQPVILDMAANG